MNDPNLSIHVVAAVIVDPRGYYLLSRRQESSDLPGLWEFPGGKREAGETSEDALRRELYEELGITAEIGDPLIQVPQIYPHKKIRLEVRHVRAWTGSLHGREGQALMWVDPHKLLRYSMPSADLPAVAALLDPDQLWIADFSDDDLQCWDEQLNDLLDHCSSRMILQRSTRSSLETWQQLLRTCVRAHRRSLSKVQCLLADQIDLARELDLGIHLSEDQLRACRQRPLASDQLVGASCSSLEGLRYAQQIRCDYAVLTITPTSFLPSVQDWQTFEHFRARVSLPLYVADIGAESNVFGVRQHGAQGIVRKYVFAASSLAGQ